MTDGDRKAADGLRVRADLQLLTPEECAAVREGVIALREHWTSWTPGLPFFTVGAASYKDAATHGYAAYCEKARALNPILRARFGGLYEALRAALARELGREFLYDPVLALPGFHVFGFHEAFTREGGAAHADLQFKDLDWSRWEGVDREDQLSLTLAIRLPAGGGGLHLWPVTYAEVHGMSASELRRILDGEPTFHPYREGGLVVHSGYRLHRIAPAAAMRPEDERITLQAHAISVRGGYVLYW